MLQGQSSTCTREKAFGLGLSLGLTTFVVSAEVNPENALLFLEPEVVPAQDQLAPTGMRVVTAR